MNKAKTVLDAIARIASIENVERGVTWPWSYTATIREPLTWREQREKQTARAAHAAMQKAEAKRARRRERNKRLAESTA